MKKLIGLALVFACDCAPSSTAVEYQGVVELHERVLGFEMPGRLLELKVLRGEKVGRGQLLAVLDDSLERPLRDVKGAEASAAEAQLDLLEAGARGEDVRAAGAQVRAARASEATLRDSVARLRQLLREGTIPPAQLDDAEGAYARAAAERQAADQRLAALRAGARSQEVRAARARASQARAALAAEDARLARFALSAPIAGAVLDTHVEPGEVVQPSTPVVTLGDTRRPYADVFVPQGDLEGIRAGTAAQIRVDAAERPFRGAVEAVGRVVEFTPRYLFSEKERPNLVVRVRVAIDDPGEALHAGVPAFVRFDRAAQARR